MTNQRRRTSSSIMSSRHFSRPSSHMQRPLCLSFTHHIAPIRVCHSHIVCTSGRRFRTTPFFEIIVFDYNIFKKLSQKFQADCVRSDPSPARPLLYNPEDGSASYNATFVAAVHISYNATFVAAVHLSYNATFVAAVLISYNATFVAAVHISYNDTFVAAVHISYNAMVSFDPMKCLPFWISTILILIRSND